MNKPAEHRLAWICAAGGSAVGAAILWRNPSRLLEPAAPVAVTCGALALVVLIGAALGDRARARLAPLIAAGRLAVVLLLVAVWRGEARELWGALAVWIAWRDAEDGFSPDRPMLPVGVGLTIAMAWHAVHPVAPAARGVLVALVAALAASRAAESRRSRSNPASREDRSREPD